ncbi:hypothetical protein [Aestuariivirga sp.]|uniref:hypothetical protein n=1 Tax=Aestuariivirga sp. TaxID=2650926 RepID=UPI00359437B0
MFGESLQTRAESWTTDWDEERLICLVKALVLAGLWADADLLISRMGDRLTPQNVRAISHASLQSRCALFARLAFSQALRQLRPILNFGCDVGLTDPERVIRAMRTAHPRNTELVASLGCEWFSRLRLYAQAINFYRESGQINTPDFITAESYRTSLIGMNRTTDAEAYLADLAVGRDWNGMSPKLALNCARALAQTGRNKRAAEFFNALQAETIGDPPRAVAPEIRRHATLEVAAQERILGGAARALEVVQKQLTQLPNNLSLIVKRIAFIFRSSGEAEAMAEALAVVRKYPCSMEIVQLISSIPFSNAVIARLLDARAAAAGNTSIPTKMAIMLMRLALSVDREDEAYALAAVLGNEELHARVVLSGRLKRSNRLSGNIRTTGFQVARGNEGGPALIVFPGIKNRVSGWPIQYFDSLIAKRGVTAIYAFDETQRLFLFGADGIASDVDGVAAHIAQIPEVANASKVLTLGTSGGGLIAVRAALAMRAQGCLTFGAKTILGRPAPNVPDLGLERLAQFAACLPPRDRDLRKAWSDNKYLHATMFYGEDHAPDVAHAQRIADRKGVDLRPVPHVREHDVFTPTLESGTFEVALDCLLAST